MLHPSRIKRAQGLPLNTIIIAALGLIVLVIIIVLVQTQIQKSGKGVREIQEAKCDSPNTVESLGTDCEVIYGSFANVKTGQQVCCKAGTIK
jgi:hypothetical protein